MRTQYESTWWKAQVPLEWSISEDEDCVTFASNESSGVIQVSAAAKEESPVTDADLEEFAKERTARKPITTVKTAYFVGIHVEYHQEEKVWMEWWLKSNNLMLYVTYNVEGKLTNAERAIVDEFISKLKPTLK